MFLDKQSHLASSDAVIESNILRLRQESFAEDALLLFRNTFEGVSEKVKNLFSDKFISEVRSFYHYYLQMSPSEYSRNFPKIESHVKGFCKEIAGFPFVSFADVNVPCPDGFKGDFTGFAKALRADREEIQKNAANIIIEFRTYMSAVISDPNSRMSLQDFSSRYKGLAKAREGHEKTIGAFFQNGVNQRQKLEKMFSGPADMVDGLLEAVETYRGVYKVDVKSIGTQAEELYQRMEVLIKMAEKKDNYQISKQTLNNLIEGAYETAKQLEHLAKYLVRCEVAVVTADNIVTQVSKR